MEFKQPAQVTGCPIPAAEPGLSPAGPQSLLAAPPGTQAEAEGRRGAGPPAPQVSAGGWCTGSPLPRTADFWQGERGAHSGTLPVGDGPVHRASALSPGEMARDSGPWLFWSRRYHSFSHHTPSTGPPRCQRAPGGQPVPSLLCMACAVAGETPCSLPSASRWCWTSLPACSWGSKTVTGPW